MKEIMKESFDFGAKYLSTIEAAFNNQNRRFDNDLLYNIIAMSFEKFMVAWLSYFDYMAGSHLPLMLYRELKVFEPELSEEVKGTAILIGSFEGICSIDDFGYKTPNDKEISKMINGLKLVQELVERRINTPSTAAEID